MRRPDQTHLARRVELAQDDREGDRVRSAGQAATTTRVSALKKRVLANELPDALQQHHRFMGWREGQEGLDRQERLASCPSCPSCRHPPELVPEDGLEPSTWRL